MIIYPDMYIYIYISGIYVQYIDAIYIYIYILYNIYNTHLFHAIQFLFRVRVSIYTGYIYTHYTYTHHIHIITHILKLTNIVII